MSDRDFLEEGMRRLLESIVQKLRQQFGGRLSSDEILAAARKAINGIDLDQRGLTWDDAPICTLAQLQRTQRLRQVVRVVGTLAEITAPQVIRVEADGEVESVCARLTDTSGATIWSLDVLGPHLVDALQRCWRSGGATEILGIVVALPVIVTGSGPKATLDDTRRSFFLHLLDVRSSGSAFDLIGATREEREKAAQMVDDMARFDVRPIDFITNETITTLGIVGLDAFPQLAALLKFTSLQAISCGRIGHASARLSAIVPGSPGSGKKLLGLAAEIQNPVAVQLSPVKVSIAGLIGASHQTPTGWVSSPGAFARGARGVTHLEDAHGWRPSVVHQVAPILQEVMEDGRVHDSVAGGIVREADTSLLIDLNRTRHVTTGFVTREAALLGIRPVLSRADLLCDLPDDAERAWSIGREMCGALGSTNVHSDPRVREIKLIVACLRDRHPRVSLDPVRAALVNAYDAVYESNKEYIRTAPESGDIPARLSITFARLITAHARGCGRGFAEPGDVEVAQRFVNMKLDFLKMLPVNVPASSGRPDPAEWVAAHAGRRVRTADIVNEYRRDTGADITERTMRTRIQEAGGKQISKGVYLLPPRNPQDNRNTGNAESDS
jgi:hypothetical protein